MPHVCTGARPVMHACNTQVHSAPTSILLGVVARVHVNRLHQQKRQAKRGCGAHEALGRVGSRRVGSGGTSNIRGMAGAITGACPSSGR